MTLHEAIESILQETGKSMTSREIANIINERGLYYRKDNLPVSASQITTRVSNYDKLFSREFGKIKLLKDDVVSLKFYQYRNEITHEMNSSRGRISGGKIQLLIEALDNLQSTSNFEGDDFILMESKSGYGNLLSKQKLKIAFRLCNWFLLQDSKFRIIFSEVFVSILSGLSWFSKGHQTLLTDIQDSNHFVLKIAADNPQASFTVHNRNENQGYYNENFSSNQVNSRVEHLINQYQSRINIEALGSTGILIPPFSKRSKRQYSTVFDNVLSELDSLIPKFQRAILIVPAGSLFSSSNDDVEARKKLINSGCLDSVILFPSGIVENSGVVLSVLIFNFELRSKDVFMFDASELLKDDTSNLIDIINSKKILKNKSIVVGRHDVDDKIFSLFPRKYTFDPSDFQIKKGYEKYNIGYLIQDKKSGKRFKNRNSLYVGGEYKLIRPSEIEKNTIYFQPKSSMLGIDHDELSDTEIHLVSGGIVLSGFNNNLKSSILSNDVKYALGQDTYWLKLKNELVLEEYLIKELSEPYVTKQVEYFSKGATISRLYLKDVLKIQVQLPSIEVQKKIVFSNFRKHEVPNQSQDVSDKEVDFIKTLKHSLKQPASGLGNDFSSLRIFLDEKIDSGTAITGNEPIVPIFNTDSLDQISIHTLSNTLERMQRAITDIDYIIDQAVQVITISEPEKENIELKKFLRNFIAEYPSIELKISGPEIEILADKKQLRILVHNFINNAIKHGFLDLVPNPTVWLEIKPKDTLSLQLSIRNNGKPLPPQFTIEDFLAKGSSSNIEVGSGFGGFLIGRILNKHKGIVEIKKQEGFGILPHNVEFLITLPK